MDACCHDNTTTNLPTYLQELNNLKNQLPSEQKKQKVLHSEIVKLKGMLKTGQDALKMEQGIVAKLQAQLKAKVTHW